MHSDAVMVIGMLSIPAITAAANATNKTSVPTADEAADWLYPKTGTWTQLVPMPTGRSGLAAAGFGGRLYVFGGEVPQLHSEVEVYNPQDDTWEKLEPMPNPRHGIFAAVIDNAIYIIGGGTQQGFGASNMSEVFVVG